MAGSPASAEEPKPRSVERVPFADTHAGHHYRISLLRPPIPPPAAGYPVIFMLDGNAVEDELANADALATTENGAFAIVMLGYDADKRFDIEARAYDYTPALTAESVERDPLDETRRTGGADSFLAFFQETILPAVKNRIPVDGSRLGLWGHSYGGLFVLHALRSAPGYFRCHIAASPSLWWRDGHLFNHRGTVGKELDGKRFDLLITHGSAETAIRPGEDNPRALARWRLNSSVPPNAAEQYARSLQELPTARISYKELPGLSHGEAFAGSLTPALRWFSACISPF